MFLLYYGYQIDEVESKKILIIKSTMFYIVSHNTSRNERRSGNLNRGQGVVSTTPLVVDTSHNGRKRMEIRN